MQTPVIYLLQTSFWQMGLGCFEKLVKVGQKRPIVVPKISKAYAEKICLTDVYVPGFFKWQIKAP